MILSQLGTLRRRQLLLLPWLTRCQSRKRRISSSLVCPEASSFVHRTSVSCLPGLEPVLSNELRALGIPHHPPVPSGRGTKNPGTLWLARSSPEDRLRCCLYLGTATRVRVECAAFRARGLAELERKTASVAWESVLAPDRLLAGRLEARATSSKSRLYHTGAIRERLLRGIHQRLGLPPPGNEPGSPDHAKEAENQSPGGGPVPTALLDVDVVRDEVQISLNAYPTPLHQRGYRKQVAKAPLREDLAFAMLLSAGWNPAWWEESENNEETNWEGLVDPFCGSGTIAIEAAAMRLGLPPGRFRATGPFRGTVLEDEPGWSAAVTRALENAGNAGRVRVAASDRDRGAVEATRANAERAGVLDAVAVERASLSGQAWFERPTESPPSWLVVTNPPFGKRVSHRSAQRTNGLLTLHQALCHKVQRVVSEHERRIGGVVLTDNPGLVTRSGASLRFQTSWKTFHGGLKVSALKFRPSG